MFSAFNFQEIRPPVLEDASLFTRSLGESTEVVQKQMFLIRREEDVYALRPEATASVVRAYIENNLDKTSGFAKLYYLGPMFRAERPQKGRLRQFHHLGCEVIGSGNPLVDVEVVSLAEALLKAFSISGYRIELNSIGCPEDKKKLSEKLHKELKKAVRALCDDCQRRFETNRLRILDCKNETCKDAVAKLDIGDSCLCSECGEHFSRVRAGLENLGIRYEWNPHLVRGLDYYTRTVFEFKHSGLGSQDALGAGGRYDTLVADLGGPRLGAIGFAFGIERLLLASSQGEFDGPQGKLTYVISLGEEPARQAALILKELRMAGIACDTDYESRSLKGALRRANDLKARYVVILGQDELHKGVVVLKDMSSGQQKEIKPSELARELAEV